MAEEILKSLGQRNGFSRERFYRGIVLPPGGTNEEGRLGDGGHFPGNVVIERGVLQKDKSILDLADCLREGDVILKGLILWTRKKAGGCAHRPPQGRDDSHHTASGRGPQGATHPARGPGKAHSRRFNGAGLSPEWAGQMRLSAASSPGEVFTEIEAIRLLTAAPRRSLSPAGGLGGAQGECIAALLTAPLL